MARRSHVWVSGEGWVKKSDSESANYDSLGVGWNFLISFFRYYPDALLDLLKGEEADYELTIIQRVIMRAKARNQYVDITGCRGLTKSYCSISEECCEQILFPSIQVAYFGPSFKQTAKIGSKTYMQLQKDYPALCDHFTISADSVDRFEIKTAMNSSFAITAFRGNNIHKVVAEETAQEENPRFDWEDYKRVILPAIRLVYRVGGKPDPLYIKFKQHSITSAGRRQNNSYDTRCRHLQMMERGESAFVMDVPYDVSLLCQMRPVSWAESLRGELTPDEWAREMESRYTGTDQNPVVPDSTLSESRSLLCMEDHHCCKDTDNRTPIEDVFYVIGYDVSYADGAGNAKCACVVVKCTKQKEWLKRDKYLKEVVWVDDWSPMNAMEQAKKLKRIWYRYCLEGHYAYISIDSWQYGTSVVQALMMDLDDGLDPLCVYNHEQYTEYEMQNAIPVIYPVKAGGVGTTDPDSEMIRYAEVQFDNMNVKMLTSNFGAGMEAYKKLHRIRDDKTDYAIYVPYKKTTELVGQIQNLKKVPNASGVSERRISKRIQRDSWSALKYALRCIQILERNNLQRAHYQSDWEEAINSMEIGNPMVRTDNISRRSSVISRKGGKLF